MAEPKVQLVAPIGNITVPGMNVTGVVTATTISGDVGVAGSIIQGNNLDIGAGINVSIQTKIQGGVVGIFLDGRGRQPFNLPKNDNKRINSLLKWSSISKEYPGEIS